MECSPHKSWGGLEIQPPPPGVLDCSLSPGPGEGRTELLIASRGRQDRPGPQGASWSWCWEGKQPAVSGHQQEPEFPAQPWPLALGWEQSVLWLERSLWCWLPPDAG